MDGLRVLDRLWPVVSLHKAESLQLRQEMVRHEAVASSKVICVNTIFLNPDGAFGSWYSSSPGNGIDAISVASIDKCVDSRVLVWHAY
jgi:hypothetical protein